MVIVNCNLFEKEIENSGIKHFKLWEKYSAIPLRTGKLFRKLNMFSLGNINPLLFNIADKEIIIFDNGIKENSVLKWFARKYSDRRLMFYYWNPVFTSIHPDKIPSKFEKWSYSPSDCEKYGLKYNSTFYFPKERNGKLKLERDVLFVGKDKGRYKQLCEYKKKMDGLGLETLFYITATHPRINRKLDRHIPYEKVIDLVWSSKCVFDYYVDPQAGLSLRAMEALFYEKKIITNNTTFASYDFFNKQNVFILEKQSLETIRDFVMTPSALVEPVIKEKYFFCNWINRF